MNSASANTEARLACPRWPDRTLETDVPLVGAFSEVVSDGLVLSDDVRSVEDGTNLVLDDAQRRARTIDRSVTKAEVEAALFPE